MLKVGDTVKYQFSKIQFTGKVVKVYENDFDTENHFDIPFENVIVNTFTHDEFKIGDYVSATLAGKIEKIDGDIIHFKSESGAQVQTKRSEAVKVQKFRFYVYTDPITQEEFNQTGHDFIFRIEA